jgi:PhnB protein
MSVSPVPQGYPRLSPYLVVDDPDVAIRFMREVLGGEEVRRSMDANGRVMHAEIRVADTLVMVGGASEQWPVIPGALHVYLEDVDAAYARALAVGATSLTPPTLQPYGDRSAYVRDAAGTTWFLSTHVEDVSDEEIRRRMAAAGR